MLARSTRGPADPGGEVSDQKKTVLVQFVLCLVLAICIVMSFFVAFAALHDGRWLVAW